MTPAEMQAFIVVAAALCTAGAGAVGGVIGHIVSDRKSKRDVEAAAAVVETTAQDRLIDQLQEELTRYRDDNDHRISALETKVDDLTEENHAYRAFIGVQRDHMAEHRIPLPPWPQNLSR